MKFLVSLLMVLGLAGFSACSSLSLNTDTKQIEAACASVAASANALAVANVAGKITPDQKTQISAALRRTSTVCDVETPPTLDSVQKQAFMQAVALLNQWSTK